MSPDAQELRMAWTRTVRAETGDTGYFPHGKKAEDIFSRVAIELRRMQINFEQYVCVQVRWVLSKNKPGTLWPTVLEGHRALERFFETPPEEQKLQQLVEYYASQAESFQRVCANLGEKVALSNNVLTHSPLFLSLMYFTTGRDIPKELAEGAAQELHAEPLARKIFTNSGFLEELRRYA